MKILSSGIRVLAVLLIISGCQDLLRKQPPPPTEEEPGPKTKEEVLALIRPIIDPIRSTAMTGSPGVSETERMNIMARIRDAITAYGGKDYGKEALRELAYEVQDLAKEASKKERYRLVMMCIDISEMLQVESQLMKRLGNKAKIMLERPKVQVRGFIDDLEKNQTYVFLELINYATGTVERREAREGDEFSNLKLVRIIGKNKAVLFEYLKVPGLFFEVEALK